MDTSTPNLIGYCLLTDGMYPNTIEEKPMVNFDDLCAWMANFNNPANAAKPKLIAVVAPDPSCTFRHSTPAGTISLGGFRDVTAEFLQQVASKYIAPTLPQPGQ